MSIGIAKMDQQRTIILELRAETGEGDRGCAQLKYPSQHPQYDAILAHVGDLSPGQWVEVEPWPDEMYVA
jgi:hypothetical protein